MYNTKRVRTPHEGGAHATHTYMRNMYPYMYMRYNATNGILINVSAATDRRRDVSLATRFYATPSAHARVARVLVVLPAPRNTAPHTCRLMMHASGDDAICGVRM